jgi:hypothetical protein
MKKISYRRAAEEPAGAYWARWREEACASFGSPRKPAVASRPVVARAATATRSFLNTSFRRQPAFEDAHAAA